MGIPIAFGQSLLRLVKVLLSISDHALYHFATDAACFARGQITVVALVQIDVQGRSDFALERVQLALGLRNQCAVSCHSF